MAGDVPPAKPFGLVQAVVGQLDEVLCGGIADITRDPGREGDRSECSAKFGAQSGIQPAQDLAGLFTVVSGEKDQEFVSAVAVYEIGGTDDLANAGREDTKQAVPFSVTQTVVDSLEIVEVKHRQAHITMVASRALQFSWNHFVHHAVVEEPSQSVARRLLLQLLRLLLVVDEQETSPEVNGASSRMSDCANAPTLSDSRLSTPTHPPWTMSGIASSDRAGHKPSTNSLDVLVSRTMTGFASLERTHCHTP